MDDRATLADLLREPLFDPERGVTIASPQGSGAGHWAGAPSALVSDGVVYLAYRLRAPAPERGHHLVVARSRIFGRPVRDGVRFAAPVVIPKEEFGALSIERCALVRIGRTVQVLVSFVSAEDARWRIGMIDDPFAQELPGRTRARLVLVPDAIGVAGVKDPWVRRLGDLWLMFVSFGPLPEHAPPDLHATGDALSTGHTRSLTGVATSRDGETWTWLGPVLEPSPGRWDDHTTRLSTAIRVGAGWIGLYDGSTLAGNYEERCGLAFSDDLIRWRRADIDGPVIGTATGPGGVRYVDVCELPDGTRRAYYEYTRPDGSHELRTAVVRDLARNLP